MRISRAAKKKIKDLKRQGYRVDDRTTTYARMFKEDTSEICWIYYDVEGEPRVVHQNGDGDVR